MTLSLIAKLLVTIGIVLIPVRKFGHILLLAKHLVWAVRLDLLCVHSLNYQGCAQGLGLTQRQQCAPKCDVSFIQTSTTHLLGVLFTIVIMLLNTLTYGFSSVRGTSAI